MNGFVYDSSDERQHTLNGERLYSITQITSYFTWFGRSHADYSEAFALGTAVHLCCELWDRRRLNESSLDARIAPYLDQWKEFTKTFSAQWTSIEEPMCKSFNGERGPFFCGRPDRVGVINGHNAIVELKTGAECGNDYTMPAYALQTMAQKHLSGIADAKRFVVLLNPDKYKVVEHTNDEADWCDFVSCFRVMKRFKLGEK